MFSCELDVSLKCMQKIKPQSSKGSNLVNVGSLGKLINFEDDRSISFKVGVTVLFVSNRSPVSFHYTSLKLEFVSLWVTFFLLMHKLYDEKKFHLSSSNVSNHPEIFHCLFNWWISCKEEQYSKKLGNGREGLVIKRLYGVV